MCVCWGEACVCVLGGGGAYWSWWRSSIVHNPACTQRRQKPRRRATREADRPWPQRDRDRDSRRVRSGSRANGSLASRPPDPRSGVFCLGTLLPRSSSGQQGRGWRWWRWWRWWRGGGTRGCRSVVISMRDVYHVFCDRPSLPLLWRQRCELRGQHGRVLLIRIIGRAVRPALVSGHPLPGRVAHGRERTLSGSSNTKPACRIAQATHTSKYIPTPPGLPRHKRQPTHAASP